MSLPIKVAWSTALAVVLLLAPAKARAQEPRIFASFTPAAVAVSGETDFGIAGTAGYRFSEHLWFEGDVTWIDNAARRERFGGGGAWFGFDPSHLFEPVRSLPPGYQLPPILPDFPGVPNFPVLPQLPEVEMSIDGYTVIGTMGIRFEPAVQTARFRPYVSAGMGINHTDRDVRIDPTPFASLLVNVKDTSHTGFAFSGGAGANIQLHRALWATVDAKYFRLSNDRNVMRFGGGVTFRF